ncbi:hypothetical protein GGX14DRAFT_404814 [Mycena pura]|uniref:Uncharacterized protein n=1 Tax=Mycena pura TaxID=153505 RepID=A0AAD6UTB7_9AGAR|nr:hypothetical protein GGX14DRAFT_404814 [Mycena pura]
MQQQSHDGGNGGRTVMVWTLFSLSLHPFGGILSPKWRRDGLAHDGNYRMGMSLADNFASNETVRVILMAEDPDLTHLNVFRTPIIWLTLSDFHFVGFSDIPEGKHSHAVAADAKPIFRHVVPPSIDRPSARLACFTLFWYKRNDLLSLIFGVSKQRRVEYVMLRSISCSSKALLYAAVRRTGPKKLAYLGFKIAPSASTASTDFTGDRCRQLKHGIVICSSKALLYAAVRRTGPKKLAYLGFKIAPSASTASTDFTGDRCRQLKHGIVRRTLAENLGLFGLQNRAVSKYCKYRLHGRPLPTA